MSEQDLVNQILDYLKLRGVWAIRVNSGGRQVDGANGKAYFIKFAPPGTPDILACAGGCFVGIECKLPGNEPTPKQLECHAQIRRAGGVVIVAYSLEDVMWELRL